MIKYLSSPIYKGQSRYHLSLSLKSRKELVTLRMEDKESKETDGSSGGASKIYLWTPALQYV